jgi:hypothetical protein
MRVLRPVVQSLVLAMLDAKAYLQPRSAVGSKLVRDHDARWRDGGFQELRHEFSRSKAVSATLDQNLKNEAVLIDGAPKPVWLSGNREDDFIPMPFVAAGRSPLADLIGDRLAKPGRPLAHGLVGYTNPSCRQHRLNPTQAQRKPEIEPNGVAYDLRRKAIAVINRIANIRHARAYPATHSKLVKLTVPAGELSFEVARSAAKLGRRRRCRQGKVREDRRSHADEGRIETRRQVYAVRDASPVARRVSPELRRSQASL